VENKIDEEVEREFLIDLGGEYLNLLIEYDILMKRVRKVLDYIDNQSFDAGVSGHYIKKILLGEEIKKND